MRSISTFALKTKPGLRKYVNSEERQRFRQAVQKFDDLERMFFLMLLWTGGRKAEILAITPLSFDLSLKMVSLVSLKKKGGREVLRHIPLSDTFIQQLDNYFDLKAKIESPTESTKPLWWFSKSTGERRIKLVMEKAGIKGLHATARGLRHGFGIWCAIKGIPVSVIQDLMGHSDVQTTMIYVNFVGIEKREMVSRIW